MYIVLSYPTKSTTLTFTDVGSSQNFQNGTELRKARQNYDNVRVYLFVGAIVAIVHRVASSSTKSTTLTFTDIGSQKKIFQNGTERRKARQILIV